MTDTTVNYHADGFGPARPAVNVKVHGPFYESGEYAALMSRLADNPMIGGELADDWAALAWDEAVSRFWADAADMARGLGLGELESTGRSGGWLELVAGDPATMPAGPERAAWLAQYRTLREWCDSVVDDAPRIVAGIIGELADARAVAP